MRRSVRLLATLAATALAAAVLTAAPAALAHDEPLSVGTIGPGVQTTTNGGQCTANFVFTDGTDLYLGQAAHCGGTGAASTAANGCEAGSVPVGTPVAIQGASQPGTLAYSSWLAMQDAGETDEDACRHNDFALVRVSEVDEVLVDPTMPHFGGPEGVDTDGTEFGDTVHTYGNSSLRLGLQPLSPKSGFSLGTTAGGWLHPVYLFTPGIPGDSGSPVLDGDGDALGVLTTLTVAPLAGSNGVIDLSRAVEYANSHGGPGVSLVTGQAFGGSALPVSLGFLGL